MSHKEAQDTAEFVTLAVAGQWLGIPVLQVKDVLTAQKIARVPLAPPEIPGSLNLRGRIVTAVDLRRRLGLPARAENARGMNVVVEHEGELYSLVVDEVGEVLHLDWDKHDPAPATLAEHWRGVTSGLFRLEGKLLLVLDVDRLISAMVSRAA